MEEKDRGRSEKGASMVMRPRAAGIPGRLNPGHAPESEPTRLNWGWAKTDSLQLAAGMVALLGVLLWTVWLFTDILLRVAY